MDRSLARNTSLYPRVRFRISNPHQGDITVKALLLTKQATSSFDANLGIDSCEKNQYHRNKPFSG
jgi:hypothetical protein